MTDSQNNAGVLPAKCWWAMGIRGIAALIFGILAFAWPGITVATIILFFGAYVLVDGLFTVVSAFMHREWPRWWAFLIEGLVGLIVGGIALFSPVSALVAVSIIVAAWAFITGVFEIVASFSLPGGFPGKWGLLAGGILSVLFGCIVVASPAAFAVMISWFIGAYAVIFGAVLIYLSYTLKCAA
ncbi:MAG: HdeD family acid-resistance protein [Candidatus Eremiobacteraeota bacterium]|nr:HdeD family acid-resistance protein [Candidatus Eremiobacteraeota bacterium]